LINGVINKTIVYKSREANWNHAIQKKLNWVFLIGSFTTMMNLMKVEKKKQNKRGKRKMKKMRLYKMERLKVATVCKSFGR
jgi:hypothetical protein